MLYDIILDAIKSCLLAAIFPFFLILAKVKAIRFVNLFFLLIFVVGSIYLKSRTAFFCILSCYFLVNQIHLQKIKKSFVIKLLGLSIVILVLVNLNSFLGRIFIYTNVLSHFTDFYLTGLGFENFKVNYADWQSNYFEKNTIWNKYYFLADMPSYAFNEWLHFWVEFGIIAPVILSFLLYKNLKYLSQSDSQIIKCCCLSNLIIFVFALISYPLHSVWVLLLFGFNHFAIFSLTHKKIKPPLCLLYLVMLIYTCRIYIKKTSATQIWEKAQLIPLTEYDEKLKLYTKVKIELYTNSYFLNDYANLFISGGMPDSALQLKLSYKKYFNQFELAMLSGYASLKKEDKLSAIISFDKATKLIPNRLIPYRNLMMTHLSIRDTLNAKLIAQKICEMPIKIQSKYTNSIKEEAKAKLNEIENHN